MIEIPWWTIGLLPVLGMPFVWLGRRSVFWGRRRLSDEETIRLFGGGDSTAEALSFLAKAYELPLGFLRPDDVFTPKGLLWKHDTWAGIGFEELEMLVQGHGLSDVPVEWTVRDFVEWYGDCVFGKNGRRAISHATLRRKTAEVGHGLLDDECEENRK